MGFTWGAGPVFSENGGSFHTSVASNSFGWRRFVVKRWRVCFFLWVCSSSFSFGDFLRKTTFGSKKLEDRLRCVGPSWERWFTGSSGCSLFCVRDKRRHQSITLLPPVRLWRKQLKVPCTGRAAPAVIGLETVEKEGCTRKTVKWPTADEVEDSRGAKQMERRDHWWVEQE